MALDPAFDGLVALLEQRGASLMDGSVPAAEVRSQLDALTVAASSIPGVAEVPCEDRTIDGRLPVRIYKGASPSAPTIVFFHGGGFVIGSIATHERQVREIASTTGAVVVSVDYRLAPEHPWPAGVDDAWAAVQWAAAHCGELGGDPARLFVAGDSAGGSLAAVVCQIAREAGGPALAGQVLLYPATDSREVAGYTSRTEHATDGTILTEQDMRWFLGHYAPDADDFRASPIVGDLHGLPPAVVVTAEVDPLHSEGVAYAEALRAAGVPVELRTFAGMPHGYFALGFVAPSVQACVDETCAMVRDLVR